MARRRRLKAAVGRIDGTPRMITLDAATQLAYEAELQGEAGRTADFREGVQAFLEKRPARYQGR